MKNPHKALEAIERLVGGGFGMDMEWLLFEIDEGAVKKIDKRLKMAAEIITQIYCISHAETSHSCRHENWEKIKYEILAKEEH